MTAPHRMSSARRILISRTDAIGDVMLTLPLAGLLRHLYPDAVIGFLGKTYTKAVIVCCSAVDVFISAEEFLEKDNSVLRNEWDTIIHVFPRRDIAWKAFRAGIRQRIGTTSRPYHILTCNALVKLSRRHSPLHEAQLNAKLLAPLGITDKLTTRELAGYYSFDKILPLAPEFASLLRPGMRHVILHPKSQGSAREWGLDHFIMLVRLLPKEKFQIFISGTAAERALLESLFEAVGDQVTDITGQMDLAMFISFINACDALVAASTGPLHIAAASRKVAAGIYPAIRPMHAGRWGPLGAAAEAFSMSAPCDLCRNVPQECVCIKRIMPIEIAAYLQSQLA